MIGTNVSYCLNDKCKHWGDTRAVCKLKSIAISENGSCEDCEELEEGAES